MNSKLGLGVYDQLSFLFTGATYLASLWLLLFLIQHPVINLIDVTWSSSIFAVFISYMIGHLIQGVFVIFSRYLKIKKYIAPKKYHRILHTAREVFELPNETKERDVIRYCTMAVLASEFSEQIRIMQSNHGMFRGLWVVAIVNIYIFVIVLGVHATVYFVENETTHALYYAALAFFSAVLFYWFRKLFGRRAKIFLNLTHAKIFTAFDILYKTDRL